MGENKRECPKRGGGMTNGVCCCCCAKVEVCLTLTKRLMDKVAVYGCADFEKGGGEP